MKFSSPKQLVMPINNQQIARLAFDLGWKDVAFTEPNISDTNIRYYRKWLKNDYHGQMKYMENTKRCFPKQMLEKAKTAIILLTPYKQKRENFQKNFGIIASYARGRDYHKTLKKRLKNFCANIEELTQGNNNAVGFCDSSPLMEKALAVQSGIGWFGKNTLVLHRKFGSFFFISICLTDLDLQKVISPLKDRCGSCTKCLDACPTKALVKPFEINAKRCLSYHTIESKEPIPKEIQEKNPGYIFGCDICQDVCPHNIRPENSDEIEFTKAYGVGSKLKLNDINKLPEDYFYGTALQRRKKHGLLYTASTMK